MGLGFLPAPPVLLRRLDHAVAQPLGVVARHHELHGGEERLDELLLLAVEVLADALGNRHRGALQLQHAQGDAVDIEHHVGPLGVLPGDRHLLGDGEVVVAGVRPVDQPDGDGLLAHVRLNLHAVAEQAVDLTVGVVEGLAAAGRGRLVQLVQRLGDGPVVVALLLEPAGEQLLLDVAVVGAIFPVAEVGVAERVLEERDHVLLRVNFSLPDSAHVSAPCSFFSVSLREAFQKALNTSFNPNTRHRSRRWTDTPRHQAGIRQQRQYLAVGLPVFFDSLLRSISKSLAY